MVLKNVLIEKFYTNPDGNGILMYQVNFIFNKKEYSLVLFEGMHIISLISRIIELLHFVNLDI